MNGPSLRQMAIAFVLLLSTSLGCGTMARAEVHLPNGEYRTTVTDLRVKALGGHVSIERTWRARKLNKGDYRWYFNPAWADLELEIDSEDGSIRSITRTGAEFERRGDDLYVLRESDRDYFIRTQRDEAGVRTGLRWTDRLGNAIDFDAAGRILRYHGRNQVAIQFGRDGDGPITSITDPANPTNPLFTWSYVNGKVSEIADYTGRRVQYLWEGDKLKKVTDVLGNVWEYEYQGTLLRTETDPEQRTISRLEYAGNRVVKFTDANENVITYEYDYNRGNKYYDIKQTSPEGVETYSRYNADGKLVRQEIGDRLVYQLNKDSAHVDISYDERERPTRTEYDANRNPIKVTFPNGASTTTTWDARFSLPLSRTDELGVSTTYEYDDRGNLLTLTEAVGLPEQRVTTATYDLLGQRLTQTVKGATPADDATTTWTYDAYGNVATMTDAEGHESSYEYDAMGNVTKRTDARGKEWITATNAAGWVVSQKDPLDHETTFAYDKVGNRLSMTDPEQTAASSTNYTYTSANRLWTITDPLEGVTTVSYTKDGLRSRETDASGVATTYAYDDDGRLVTITDGAGNVTTLVYGSDCSNEPAHGLAGLLTATRFPTYCEEYKYDAIGNRTQVIKILPGANGEPDQRLATTTGYDARGRVISETDPLGRTTQSAYDALGRLISVTDALGGVTAYGYDARDNVVTVTDANEHTHRFTYDKLNRVLTEARPLGQTIAYAYDANGNLTTRTSPKGERRVYTYDDANRRVTENHYPAATETPSQGIVYTYDGRNQLTGYTQTGDTFSAASYVYDAKGQKLDETVTYDTGPNAFSKTIHYAYEPNGLKKSLTYPDGTVQTSTYDKNRLASISIKGHTIRYQDYSWRVPTRVTMPGATRTLTYDPLQRPTRILSESIGGAVIMDYRYTYDAAGNISQRTTEDGDYLYSHDALNRLTGATPPISLQQGPANPDGLPIEQYTYDPVHNRKTSAHQPGSWSYNDSNELIGSGIGSEEQGYQYDANGNTVEQKTGTPSAPSRIRQLVHNAAERLTQVDDNGAIVGRYQYDPMGRRIKKETQQEAKWFQYASDGLIAEYAEDGSLQRAYGWKPVTLWGTATVWLADLSGATWAVHFYHNDHLDTSQRITDIAGNETWKVASEAFGKARIIAGAISNPMRLPGQYFDAEIALNYNYFRNYEPDVGRYLQFDPVGLRAGPNSYLYASANPLRLFDPSGLSSTEKCDCAREAGDEAPWLGAGVDASGTAFVAGLSGSLGRYVNTFTGERCTVLKFCPLRVGLGFGASGGAMGQITFVGPYCGSGLGGPSCEVSFDAVKGAGIGMSATFCSGFGVGGELRGLAGAQLALTFNWCYSWVLGCTGTPCECGG